VLEPSRRVPGLGSRLSNGPVRTLKKSTKDLSMVFERDSEGEECQRPSRETRVERGSNTELPGMRDLGSRITAEPGVANPLHPLFGRPPLYPNPQSPESAHPLSSGDRVTVERMTTERPSEEDRRIRRDSNKTNVTEYREEGDQLRSEIVKLIEKNQLLREVEQESRKRICNLQIENDSLKNQLSVNSANYDTVLTKNISMEEQIKTLLEKNSGFRKEIGLLQDMVKTLEAELHSLRESESYCRSLKEKRENQFRELLIQMKQEESRVERIIVENEALKDRLAQCLDFNKRLVSEIESLTKKKTEKLKNQGLNGGQNKESGTSIALTQNEERRADIMKVTDYIRIRENIADRNIKHEKKIEVELNRVASGLERKALAPLTEVKDYSVSGIFPALLSPILPSKPQTPPLQKTSNPLHILSRLDNNKENIQARSNC